jgi:hypothetical protein
MMFVSIDTGGHVVRHAVRQHTAQEGMFSSWAEATEARARAAATAKVFMLMVCFGCTVERVGEIRKNVLLQVVQKRLWTDVC